MQIAIMGRVCGLMALAYPIRFAPPSPGLPQPRAAGMLPVMDRKTVNRLCATLPGAEQSDPWGGGHDAWKIGGKMFACIGSVGGGVSVKTPDIETASMLIEVGAAERAPYFHRSWVLVPFGSGSEDDLRHRLEVSYETVRKGLPKKVQGALPPWEKAD